MGILIQLAIYVAVAGALWFGVHTAWTGFKNSIAAPYVQTQIAHDQEVVNAANKRADDAEARVKNAQADTAACTTAVNDQTAQVRRWKAEADRRLAESVKAKAEAQAAHQVSQTAISRYQEIAARPPIKDETCEAQLGKVDKLLRDAARARAAAKAGK